MHTLKINESFYRVKGTLPELQPIMKRLQVDKPNAYFDPMVKRGLKPAYEKFYMVHEGDLIIPSGFIPFLSEYGVYKDIVSPEFLFDEIYDYIENNPLPFKPYDYQINAVVECIMNYQQIALAATGCLDGNSEIDVIIDGYSEEEIQAMLNS